VVIFTVEVLTIVLSTLDIAVIVTAAGVGAVAGAVYTPADVMVPNLALPPVMSLTCQVTESSVVLATVAVKA
jgi:hypothetical protein